MRCLIVSDTHGKTNNLDQVLEEIEPIDYFFHLGDICDVDLFTSVEISCPKAIIAGNNDYWGPYPKETMVDLAGHSIWICHGHRYGIYYGTEELKDQGRSRGADIVMCGHSHVPVIDIEDDVWVVNPGSLTYPRQANKLPSYIIMDIDDSGEVSFVLKYIE